MLFCVVALACTEIVVSWYLRQHTLVDDAQVPEKFDAFNFSLKKAELQAAAFSDTLAHI